MNWMESIGGLLQQYTGQMTDTAERRLTSTR